MDFFPFQGVLTISLEILDTLFSIFVIGEGFCVDHQFCRKLLYSLRSIIHLSIVY